MRHAATFLFPFPRPLADAIAGALSPETRQTEVPKTRGEVAATDEGLRVVVHAADLPSLRAAVNSYLRWVDAAEKAARLAGGGSSR